MFESYSMDRRTGNHGIRFDGTINFGNVLAVAGLLIAIWSWAGGIDRKLTTIETKIDPMWQAFNNHGRGNP